MTHTEREEAILSKCLSLMGVWTSAVTVLSLASLSVGLILADGFMGLEGVIGECT